MSQVVYRASSSHLSLVRSLQRQWKLSERVAHGLSQVDRADFSSGFAYDDAPQYISSGATISAPHMHAIALQALSSHLQPAARLLDVGCGSGYLCAALAYAAGDRSRIVGIDHIPKLVELSLANISRNHSHLLRKQPAVSTEASGASRQRLHPETSHSEAPTVEIYAADGFSGWPVGAPYDAIHVGAAPREIPVALLEQLKPGGVMVLPYGPDGGQVFSRITRLKDSGKGTADAGAAEKATAGGAGCVGTGTGAGANDGGGATSTGAGDGAGAAANDGGGATSTGAGDGADHGPASTAAIPYSEEVLMHVRYIPLTTAEEQLKHAR